MGVRIRLEERSQLYGFHPKNDLEKGCGATMVAVLSPYESKTLRRGHTVFPDVVQRMRTVDIQLLAYGHVCLVSDTYGY